jgi:flagellar basal-body rod protein FlgC
MDIFRALGVSASGLAAQRTRMDVVAENLANTDSTQTVTGGPYRRKLVTLAQSGDPAFAVALRDAAVPEGGVRVTGVTESREPFRRVHQPDHPHAGPDGFVSLPNVNPLKEMVDMMLTTRAYEANATAFAASKSLAVRLLELLR